MGPMDSSAALERTRPGDDYSDGDNGRRRDPLVAKRSRPAVNTTIVSMHLY